MTHRVLIVSAIVILIAIGAISQTTFIQQAEAATGAERRCPCPKAPIVTSGDNIYIAWWTNNTGNDEVMFRASTDGGKTFGEKVNLSNTPNADSQEVEIATFGDNKNKILVTWWETNQTSNEPVFRISTDNGTTFDPTMNLSTNGTIGSSSSNTGG
ncbi:MAG TPA: sialidase family protein [Candidatus Nitrosocosmicus sp.]|nr:sialidase family protein [Candidatus Nitrosocosmicus sp.]